MHGYNISRIVRTLSCNNASVGIRTARGRRCSQLAMRTVRLELARLARVYVGSQKTNAWSGYQARRQKVETHVRHSQKQPGRVPGSLYWRSRKLRKERAKTAEWDPRGSVATLRDTGEENRAKLAFGIRGPVSRTGQRWSGGVSERRSSLKY